MEVTATSFAHEPLSSQTLSSVARKMSALRVFLTCTSQETRDLLLEYQLKAAAEKCFSTTRIHSGSWDFIFALLHKLQNCLDNCLRSEGAELWYGLSAIGAAQEGLASAVSVSNKWFGNNLHISLAEDHSLRAKLITNGLIAKLGKDYELESLWLLAAEQVYRQIESMMYFDKTSNANLSVRRLDKVKEHLASAATFGNTVEGVHPEQAELRHLISRQFRRAAVCIILERKHVHLYAAETYQYAASLSDMVPDPSTTKLLQTAVSTMRLAGDMIAVHTDENSAKSDTLITQTIATAKRLVENARSVPHLKGCVEEWKGKVIATKAAADQCKDAFIAPALQLLMEKQAQVLGAREQYLQALLRCESMSDAAIELQRVRSTAETEAAALQGHIDKLPELAQSAQYFSKRAKESDRLAYCELRPLVRRCWKKASEHADAVLQLHASLIQGGSLTSTKCDRHHAIIRTYVTIAERVLGSAVEYLDKARGAEAEAGEKSGRDPREAQLWRQAAECMVQEAKETLAAQVMPVFQLTNKQAAVVLAAEYLSLSHQYIQSTNRPRLHAQQISAWFKQLAELQILRASRTEPISARIDNSERPIFGSILRFIALLSTSDTISTAIIQNNQRACEYGCRYLRAVYANMGSTEAWNKVLALYFTTVSQHYYIKQVNPREAAGAAVCALAADAIEKGREFFALACLHAGSLLTTQHSSYYVALATKIIVIADHTAPISNPTEIPPELCQLQIDNNDAELFPLLDKHVAAYIMLSDCEHQQTVVRSDPVALKMWKDAEGVVNKLIAQLASYADSRADTISADTSDRIAYHQATAECYCTAAKVCSAGEEKQVCVAAIDMCNLADRVNDFQYKPWLCGMATVTIEHYVLALKTRLKGGTDPELSKAWDKVARRARFLFELRLANKNETAARSDWKHAECVARALVAQRNGRGKLSKLWDKATRRWEKVRICLHRMQKIRGIAYTTMQVMLQKLRKEAEEQEAITRAAQIASDESLEDIDDVATLTPAAAAAAQKYSFNDTSVTTPTAIIKVQSIFNTNTTRLSTSHKLSSSSSQRIATAATALARVTARGGAPSQSTTNLRSGSAGAVLAYSLPL